MLYKDEEKEAKCELEEVSVAEILEAQREEQLAKEEQERAKSNSSNLHTTESIHLRQVLSFQHANATGIGLFAWVALVGVVAL